MSVKNHWQGRIDVDTGDTRRWHQVVEFWPDQINKSAVGLLGYPTDDGVLANHGRSGPAATMIGQNTIIGGVSQ